LALKEPLETGAAWVALHSAHFGSLDRLGRACRQLSKPGLIVVESDEEETQALAWGFPPGMDICRAKVLRAQLGGRFKRLLESARHGFAGAATTLVDPVSHKAVYSREYLDTRLAREFASARKHCRSLSLAWIDLAPLDRIAKIHGREAGNRHLDAFVRTAFANIRVTDWLARYSEEEFCLTMPDTWLEEGRAVALRIQEALASTRVETDGGPGFAPGVSFGVAELTDAEQSYEDLIQNAAEAALLETLSARVAP
jgi:diguanylate cyclase (GGDEF)-like protein